MNDVIRREGSPGGKKRGRKEGKELGKGRMGLY